MLVFFVLVFFVLVFFVLVFFVLVFFVLVLFVLVLFVLVLFVLVLFACTPVFDSSFLFLRVFPRVVDFDFEAVLLFAALLLT